ncbi:hypothetical protein FJY90_04635 [Candidatus Gottesmanbacteria bacterium]|nr:hypothetical protein [Candidatus Gottesmanbacteria bacterium]
MVAPVESPTLIGDKRTLLERFIESLRRLFRRKLELEKAEEAQSEMREAETKSKRNRADREKDREDKNRDYQKRLSEEDTVGSLDAARQLRAQEVKANLTRFIEKHGRAGSGYIYELVRDESLRRGLDNLIDESPAAANLINNLVTQGAELYGNPTALLNIGRNLLYEAQVARMPEAVRPLLNQMADTVKKRLPEVIEVYNRQAHHRGEKEYDRKEWLQERLDLKIDPADLSRLDSREWVSAIDNMLTNPPQDVPGRDMTWTDVGDIQHSLDSADPPRELVTSVEEIWQKVERSEKAGEEPLSVDEIKQLEREILAAQSRTFPKDVIPGTEAYHKIVYASDKFINERLDKLGRQLSERLKTDRPPLRKGITDTAEFLDEMARHPGNLGNLLNYNPEMEKLLVGDVPISDQEQQEKSARFRNQVFLTIHSQILTDRSSSSHENFGLHERADFTTFTNLIRSKMADRIRPETGLAFGQSWVDWFSNLSTTIRLSRDIDFWAAQPGASIDDFNKSLSLFATQNSVQALSMPAVEVAFRAYEDALNSIKTSNGGYIPPPMVGYDAGHMVSYWDTSAQLMLERKILAGVVYDTARDKRGQFPIMDRDGHTLKLGKKFDLNTLKKEDRQDLELSMYMTLAKGFGLASLRFLEMFANSRVPGSTQPGFNMDSFHSQPYEGPARALNYFATMIHKWKFGAYRYMHMMNTLLPEVDKIRHIDSREPMKAYIAYRDGTFAEKYGKKAKRLIDKMNFSGFSSAFGPPYTTWRHMDTTIGWSDKNRELLGGPTQIMLSERFAKERIKDFLVVGKYREMYRRTMAQAGMPTSGTEFDRLWQERGKPMYDHQIETEWEKLQKDHKLKKQIEHLKERYKKAFISRVWVETAMRNPLAVAHNLEVTVPNAGFENDPDPKKKVRKVKLHSYLIEQVLGISPEDLKYADVSGRAGPYTSPSEKQRGYIAEVMSLEADLAAVREIAINGSLQRIDGVVDEGNRELKESDFDVIKSRENKQQALRYWKLLRKLMFGDEDPRKHEELYEKLGLKLSENGQDYGVDWKKIEDIDKILEDLGDKSSGVAGVFEGKVMLNKDLAEKEWENIFGTDDTAYRKMAILNLGARQWVRRGGDAMAHYHGGERVGQYLSRDLLPNPDVEKLAEALMEIRNIYEGDMIEAGWQVVGLLVHGTARLYSLDIKRLGSAAQLDIWPTRRGVAAWTANGRRKFFDAIEHADVLPPQAEAWGYDIPEYTDIHELRKLNRADNVDVWIEIITLGIAMAVIITIWRGLTAKSEEEEESGGGGH